MEHESINKLRLYQTTESLIMSVNSLIINNIGSIDEVLVSLITSEIQGFNKHGVQFYACRNLENIMISLLNQLHKANLLITFLSENGKANKNSIFCIKS